MQLKENHVLYKILIFIRKLKKNKNVEEFSIIEKSRFYVLAFISIAINGKHQLDSNNVTNSYFANL